MTPPTLLAALALAALALAGSSPGERSNQRASAVSCGSRVSSAYVRRVDGALRARRDVWGESLLRARGGPTYGGARRYLEPLLFARGPRGGRLTDSGVYYLPFGMPTGAEGSSTAALHVADGSQILAGRAGGPSLTIGVGPAGRERYGSCLSRLGTPRLDAGYLPILETSYVDGQGVRYRQESFAAREADGPPLVSYVRLVADARDAQGDTEIGLTPSAGSPTRYPVAAGALTTVYASWRIGGSPGGPVSIDGARYAAARASVVDYWTRRLSEGAQIVVPERRVFDAERALLIQDLTLTWRYSIGNPYQEFSYPEGIDVAEVMAALGFEAVSRAILVRSLGQPVTRYPNWKMGQKLVGSALQYRLYHDGAFVRQATPVLAGYVDVLGRQVAGSPLGILRRERYSSDIPDSVYGLHSQAIVWQGLRTMADVWRETGRSALAARCARLADRLERGLLRAITRSTVELPDGSLFLDVRLLDRVRPYPSVTRSRLGSYWNLVMPYALASGLFAPGGPDARGVLRYMLLHGSRLLGVVRAGAFSLYGRTPAYPESGVNPVYGLNVARFLADDHEPDQLVLSLYGQLATAMTRGTFVAGEAASVAPIVGQAFRSMYRPPNGASNASFLETLRLVLVHEARSHDALPNGLELGCATPRAWLAPGKETLVRDLPTSFGPVSFEIRSESTRVRVSIDVPRRSRIATLRLCLRLPAGERIARVVGADRPSPSFDAATGTIDLSGLSGHVELVADVLR